MKVKVNGSNVRWWQFWRIGELCQEVNKLEELHVKAVTKNANLWEVNTQLKAEILALNELLLAKDEVIKSYADQERALLSENKRLEHLLNPKRSGTPKVKGHEIKPKQPKGWVKRVYLEDKNA